MIVKNFFLVTSMSSASSPESSLDLDLSAIPNAVEKILCGSGSGRDVVTGAGEAAADEARK